MQGICGVFSSTVTAAWVEALGTVLAAAIAVGIYLAGRCAQRRDIAGRRAVLHSMLKHWIDESAPQALDIAEALNEKSGTLMPRSEWNKLRYRVHPKDQTRLIELQPRLMEFGEADDAAIAQYIESCISYARSLERLDARVRMLDEVDVMLDEKLVADANTMAGHARPLLAVDSGGLSATRAT